MSTDPSAYAVKSVSLNGSLLTTEMSDSQGEQGASTIDLNKFIGNVNGALSWGGTDFASGAQNITLSPDGNTLEADLRDSNGDLAHSVINLNRQVVTHGDQLGLQHSFAPPHSTAHAIANTNEQADQAVLAQAQSAIVGADTYIDHCVTVKGDAANYWPGDVGNAPAPGAAAGVDLYFHLMELRHMTGGRCIIL